MAVTIIIHSTMLTIMISTTGMIIAKIKRVSYRNQQLNSNEAVLPDHNFYLVDYNSR